MPSDIILLAPPIDSRWLAGILLAHDPALSIAAVSTLPDLERQVTLRPTARLIGFLTGVVVPPSILAALAGPAYNLHPGPPAYPGRHPLAFALYDGAARFGATAHEMVERVDSGPIVGAAEFDVPPGIDHEGLKELAYRTMIRLFQALAPALARVGEPLPHAPLRWGSRRCTDRALKALCDLPSDLDRAEFERRLRAFAGAEGAVLSTTLHGRRFTLVS